MNDLLIYRNGDPAFGALTLSLPFMPAICMFLLLPCAGKGVFKAAFESLPVVHLFNKYKALKEIITLHKKIASLKDSKVIDKKNEELDKIKSSFQDEKVWPAMLESAPQFVLQLSILVKKYYAGDADDLTDPVTILQIGTSVLSVLMTTSGLLTEMTIEYYKTPRRSLWFTYGQIFPLVTMAVTPRLCTIAAIASFATLENWIFYFLSFLAYSTLHGICCFGFGKRLKKQWKLAVAAVFGYFTSLIAPCMVFYLKSNFIVWTSLSSSVLLSIGLGSMLAIANYQPSLIFDSSTSYTTLTEALEHYCMVLIPLLLLSNLIYYLINKLVNNMNKHLL